MIFSKTAPTIKTSIAKGELKIVGAYYDVKSGEVMFL
jgi:carbonic anhydrase